MKKTEQQITELYKNANFDAQNLKKAAVYAKVFEQKNKKTSFRFAYAAAAVLLLTAGFFTGTLANGLFNAKTQAPLACTFVETEKDKILTVASAKTPAPQDSLTEEDCADLNTKYLLSQAAAQQSIVVARTTGCPTKNQSISSYDSKIIAVMEKEIKTHSSEQFTDEDMKKLKLCNTKFTPKVQPLIIYRMQC
ncbi:UPF0716 family protein affecting phage T7 exclusion [Elusimicrobium posterum]|uniref:hypothetical protein n=1 Tax=Elusimicrobium posterum TaxID=3116653 RepID=UPI003C714BEB